MPDSPRLRWPSAWARPSRLLPAWRQAEPGRPWKPLEKLAGAVGQELVVGVGAGLSSNRSIAELVRKGHALVR